MLKLELAPLQWLGVSICPHEIRRTAADADALLLDIVRNEEVVNVHVSCFLSAGSFAILFEQNAAHVVLKDDIVFHLNSLCLKKEACPEDEGEDVINADDLCLR